MLRSKDTFRCHSLVCLLVVNVVSLLVLSGEMCMGRLGHHRLSAPLAVDHAGTPALAFVVSRPSSCMALLCFLEFFPAPLSCKSLSGLTFFFLPFFVCITQGITNPAWARGLTSAHTGSESKHEVDIWCGLVHFGWFSLDFCRRCCCLPRVKGSL